MLALDGALGWRRALRTCSLLLAVSCACAPATHPTVAEVPLNLRVLSPTGVGAIPVVTPDDPRWSSLRALPASALPRGDASDPWLTEQQKAVVELHTRRCAQPSRRDMAAVTSWAKEVDGLDPMLPAHVCAAQVLSTLRFSEGRGTRRIAAEGSPGPITPFRYGAYRLAGFSALGTPDDARYAMDDWRIAAEITNCKKGPPAAGAAAWDVTLEVTPSGSVSRAALRRLAGPTNADEESCVRAALMRLKFGCPLGPEARIEARICATRGTPH